MVQVRSLSNCILDRETGVARYNCCADGLKGIGMQSSAREAVVG